jgi:hypothetical protein
LSWYSSLAERMVRVVEISSATASRRRCGPDLPGAAWAGGLSSNQGRRRHTRDSERAGTQ